MHSVSDLWGEFHLKGKGTVRTHIVQPAESDVQSICWVVAAEFRMRNARL
jgi:hypothetical protein